MTPSGLQLDGIVICKYSDRFSHFVLIVATLSCVRFRVGTNARNLGWNIHSTYSVNIRIFEYSEGMNQAC